MQIDYLYLPPQPHPSGLQIYSHQNINDPMDRIEKMKSVWSLLWLLLLLPGCTKEEPSHTVIYAVMEIRVVDAQGNNLLDPTFPSPKTVDASKLKLYLVKEGKEELFDRKTAQFPKGVFLLPPKETGLSYYTMRLFLNTETHEKITTTILEWEDGHRDIIKAEFYRPKNTSSIFQQRIWVNDKLIWDILNKIGGDTPTYTVTR